MEYDVELEERIRYIEDMIKLENGRITDMEEESKCRTELINAVLTTLIVTLSIVTLTVAMKELL